MELGGLHHLTAVTTDAGKNVEFYTGVLGMRLVKKTVNQDDVSAYHLFYGDEVGNPGTEVTFFDWPQLRVAPNHPGAGEVSTTELRVPDASALDWWAGRRPRAAGLPGPRGPAPAARRGQGRGNPRRRAVGRERGSGGVRHPGPRVR